MPLAPAVRPAQSGLSSPDVVALLASHRAGGGTDAAAMKMPASEVVLREQEVVGDGERDATVM